MKISVIIPTYNSAATIAACIESVLCQTFTDYSLIVVDDGSTDGSGDIIDGYANCEAHVCVLHQPNKGRSEARRKGVEMANGEWICFVDSDDTLPPDALENLARGIAADVDIVFGNG